ncbi:MAG: biotin/lipoyl-binding protein, partial [Candidatus Peribacteraceae bacterium]|nr:biotin/lipoyl-binding protein [Candidatus Peribacteraceae bacterium]
MSSAFLHNTRQIFSRYGLRLGAGIVLLIAAIGVTYAAVSPKSNAYQTTVITRGDIHRSVEAVGTVISENDLGLQFRSSGIVSEVLVKEGDTVTAGQRLAALRAGDIGAGVSAAAAHAREAEAALRALQEGTRPEEITIAEAQLDSKRMGLDTAKTILSTAEESLAASQAKLEALKKEADTSLSSQVGMAGSVASQKLTTVEQALNGIDDVFNSYGVSDVVILMGSSTDGVLRAQVSSAKSAIMAAKQEQNPTDYRAALSLMDQAHAAIQGSVDALSTAYDFLITLPETRSLAREDKETYKNTLAAKRSTAQSTLTELDTWVKGLKDASAVYDTRIATEEGNLATAKGAKEKAEADIRSLEIAIRIDEANLALKRAGPRQTDIDAAEARWQAARADTARASANYTDTQIIAPI